MTTYWMKPPKDLNIQHLQIGVQKKAPALLAQELFYYRTLEGFYWLSTGIASPVYCVFVTCSVALNALITLLFASNSA